MDGLKRLINKKHEIFILGEKYTIILTSDETGFPILKNANGYIDDTVREIVVKDSFDNNEFGSPSNLILKNIRHEIIHAFLYESGLDFDSAKSNSWATNEEMVDFFAIQFPKMKVVIDDATLWFMKANESKIIGEFKNE